MTTVLHFRSFDRLMDSAFVAAPPRRSLPGRGTTSEISGGVLGDSGEG